MKNWNWTLRLAVLAAFVVGAYGQAAETLHPAQATGTAIGKGRPLTEAVGTALATSPDAKLVFPELDEAVLTNTPTPIGSQKFIELNLLDLAAATHRNVVNVAARHADGTPFYSYTSTNLRTNAGANWQADIMANTSTPSVNAQCNYVALTNDSTSPAVTGTTLTSEIAANGLSRAQGTYARTSNATSYTIAKTFTASGTQASQQTALFTASSSGTECFWNTYTAVTVNNTDTLTVTWTINF